MISSFGDKCYIDCANNPYGTFLFYFILVVRLNSFNNLFSYSLYGPACINHLIYLSYAWPDASFDIPNVHDIDWESGLSKILWRWCE